MTDETTRQPTGASNEGLERRDLLRGVTAAGLGGLGLSSLPAAAAHPKPHTVTVRAVEVPLQYEIVVSGEIAKGPRAGGTDRIVDSNVARGFIDTVGEVDNFRFSGQITAFNVNVASAAEVFVNGQSVENPVGLPGQDEQEPELPNKITVRAQGTRAPYRFTVTGQVVRGPRAGQGEEQIQGRTVTGVVGGRGSDDFRYSGDLTFVSGDEPLRVVLDLNQN